MNKMFVFIFVVLVLAGCSTREIIVVDQQKYVSRYRPLIGSQNNDARTIIDYGVVLKIWIAPYKDKYGSLISSHDNYVWADRPDFVPGSAVPQIKSDSGITTPNSKLPFSVSPKEIDRGDLKSDEVINEFINQSYKNTKSSILQRIQEEKSNIKTGNKK